METMFVTFMVAVVGWLVLIWSEIHQINKSLKVNKQRGKNANKNNLDDSKRL